jgi:hypothetical protein
MTVTFTRQPDRTWTAEYGLWRVHGYRTRLGAWFGLRHQRKLRRAEK